MNKTLNISKGDEENAVDSLTAKVSNIKVREDIAVITLREEADKKIKEAIKKAELLYNVEFDVKRLQLQIKNLRILRDETDLAKFKVEGQLGIIDLCQEKKESESGTESSTTESVADKSTGSEQDADNEDDQDEVPKLLANQYKAYQNEINRLESELKLVEKLLKKLREQSPCSK